MSPNPSVVRWSSSVDALGHENVLPSRAMISWKRKLNVNEENEDERQNDDGFASSSPFCSLCLLSSFKATARASLV